MHEEYTGIDAQHDYEFYMEELTSSDIEELDEVRKLYEYSLQ